MMNEYAKDLHDRPLTANEAMMAAQYYRGAREAGCEVTLATVHKVFVPGIRDLMTRYLQGC